MAEIHRTTMTPSKLELLTAWLPHQPWYAGHDEAPRLTRVGGFRLDDPAGEVGLELLFVGDDAGGRRTTYSVPMTYRGEPVWGGEPTLVGRSEHGVLGPRWLYDGAYDRVLTAQLLALLQHQAQPQHQTESATPDPSVEVHGRPLAGLVATSFEVFPGHDRTTLSFQAEDTATGEAVSLLVHVLRVLVPGDVDDRTTGVVAPWRGAHGSERGPVVLAEAPRPAA